MVKERGYGRLLSEAGGESNVKEVVIAIIAFVILCLLYALPVMLMWNCVIPDVCGFSRINYEQALCITVLIRLLFGNTSGKERE